MLTGPGFVIRHVGNLDQTKAFYADVLGLAIEDDQTKFVQFAGSGGTTFALGLEGQGDPMEIWWMVDDADAEHERLKARGAKIVAPPTDMPFGRTVALEDPAGQKVYLLQPPARGAQG